MMNERIKELKQQAEAYVDSVDDGLGIEHYRELVDLKFAELIIEECAQQCWTVSELESRGFVVSECTKRMRKHFGVKE